MDTPVKLDWTKLLGFDQAGEPQTVGESAAIADHRVARIGTKLGVKSGTKPDLRTGQARKA